MNKELLKEMIEKKYVVVKKHPDADLYIYNYSKSCQYEAVWNEITLQCRGLILDADMNIVSRPFGKFFNWQELINMGTTIPKEKFTYSTKMDGSLGILYKIDGEYRISTRGSFTSDQAIVATDILKQYDDVVWKDGITYLFEIIYPENRIVLDYGNDRELVLLATIDNETGLNTDDMLDLYGRVPQVEINRKAKSFESIEDDIKDDEEGFVITFESGFRMKIKGDEYCRLHRIVTRLNKKAIWEYLSEGKDLEEVRSAVPEEFIDWIDNTSKELWDEYNLIDCSSIYIYDNIDKNAERKDQAKFILSKTKTLSGIVFNMLDGKDYSKTIWARLKPRGEE